MKTQGYYGLNKMPVGRIRLYFYLTVNKTLGKTMIGELDCHGMTANCEKKSAGKLREEKRGVRQLPPNRRPENWKRKRV